jgi:hypothetical protein
MGDDQVKRYNDGEEYNSLPRPISEDFRFFIGDGAPVEMIGRILDGDSEGKYTKIAALIGVFHFFMEVFKEVCKAFEEPVMFFIEGFLGKIDGVTTDNNLRYWMDFSDPLKPEQNLGSILLAFYTHVARVMKRKGEEGANPVSMNRFLLEKSKQSPQAMLLFICIRFFETVLLVRASERLNKFETRSSRGNIGEKDR